MMPTIKFSHPYSKMPSRADPSTLLEVVVVDRDDLSPQFIAYDTHIVGGGHYNPPVGKLLMLLLQAESGELWTTIRRCTTSKHDYYRSLRGKSVRIEIVELNKSLGDYS